MKRLYLKSLILAALLSGNMSAHAEDGTINFTGVIEDGTCSISADSKAVVVDFGQVSMTEESLEDPMKTFAINLEDCPGNISKASVEISGDALEGGSLSDYVDGVKQTTSAWDVGFYIDNKSHIFIPANGDAVEYPTPLVPGNNTINMYAKFYHNDLTPIATGEHSGDATYTIIYQ